ACSTRKESSAASCPAMPNTACAPASGSSRSSGKTAPRPNDSRRRAVAPTGGSHFIRSAWRFTWENPYRLREIFGRHRRADILFRSNIRSLFAGAGRWALWVRLWGGGVLAIERCPQHDLECDLSRTRAQRHVGLDLLDDLPSVAELGEEPLHHRLDL